MAIFATQAKRVTDEMFIEAAQAVAERQTKIFLTATKLRSTQYR